MIGYVGNPYAAAMQEIHINDHKRIKTEMCAVGWHVHCTPSSHVSKNVSTTLNSTKCTLLHVLLYLEAFNCTSMGRDFAGCLNI